MLDAVATMIQAVFDPVALAVEAQVAVLAATIQARIDPVAARIHPFVDPLATGVKPGVRRITPILCKHGHRQGEQCEGGDPFQFGVHSGVPSAKLMLPGSSTPMAGIG
jgi:hypothetical protein